MPKKKPRRKAKPKSLPGEIVGEMNGFPVRRVQVGAITGADYNPREITEGALAGLRASIEEFGLPQPVVWNKRTKVIVGGHQRLSTLEPDEFTDVVEVDLDLKDEKALNLALNSPYMAGEFNTNLEALLDELAVKAPDLSDHLKLEEMRVDVPSFDVDDLIDDEHGVNSGGKDSDQDAGVGTTPRDQANDYENNSLRQIVLVLTKKQNDKVTDQFKNVMKEESLDSFSNVALHLAREYQEAL